MEAIKFSELPSGDRMPLADEDGVPIIANQENRLLTWGRLKQQIAAQTHTDTVDESEKVPTAKAVFGALGSLDSDLHDEFNEKIDDTQAKAEGANATAKSALASAGSASRDAQSAENKAVEALNKIAEAKSVAEAAQQAADSIAGQVNSAISTAETAQGKAEEALAKVTETSTVDLTPITKRLDTVEGKNTAQDEKLDTLGNIEISDGVALYITLDDYGDWSGDNLSYASVANQTMELSEALNLLFLNQKKLFAMIRYLYQHQSDYNSDIAKIMDNITSTLNSVVK